ncbi:MAG: endonuclease domain-containing protein, partial [Rhizobiaceae bacterium]
MPKQPHPPAPPAPSPGRGGKPAPIASIARARHLRSHMSEEEIILWSELRLLRKQDLHFRRQVPYGPYVLDFACLKAKLAVEVDGEQHFHGDGPKRDAVRDRYFTRVGFLTLRYTTTEIRKELDSVVTDIFRRTIERRFPPLVGEGGPKGLVG